MVLSRAEGSQEPCMLRGSVYGTGASCPFARSRLLSQRADPAMLVHVSDNYQEERGNIRARVPGRSGSEKYYLVTNKKEVK